MSVYAVIPAAGSGKRYDNSNNKLLENFAGKPVIIHTLEKISDIKEISGIVICTSTDIKEQIEELVKKFKIQNIKDIILGGNTRQESVFKGLQLLEKYTPDLVLIHDGARPLIKKEIIVNSINFAKSNGSAVVAVPVKDTVKKVNQQYQTIIETLNRNELYNIQTPQIFKYKELLKAHSKHQNSNFTDDAGMLEKMGFEIKIFNGDYENIKITTKEDLVIAEILYNKL